MNNQAHIRVFWVDDHPLLIEGIARTAFPGGACHGIAA